MSKDKVGAADQVAVAVGKPADVYVHGEQAMVCWETGPDGQPRQVWAATASNGLVREGLGMLGNFVLGGQRVTSNGPFLVLHNAGYNSSYGWAQLSGSQVSGYSASLLPLTFASTNNTATQWTASTNLSFSHAGTQTVSGAALIMYTSASCSTAPANSSDVKLFNIGSFTAAQNVQSNNTLSVTVSINVTTS